MLESGEAKSLKEIAVRDGLTIRPSSSSCVAMLAQTRQQLPPSRGREVAPQMWAVG